MRKHLSSLFLPLHLTFFLGLSTVTPAYAQSTSGPVLLPNFSDTTYAGHWATQSVNLLAAHGLVQGYPDGTYRGDQPLTRYEAAAIFERLLLSGALQGAIGRGSFTSDEQVVLQRGAEEVGVQLSVLDNRVVETIHQTDSLTQQQAVQQAQINQLGLTSATRQEVATVQSALAAEVSTLQQQLQDSQQAGAAAEAEVTELRRRLEIAEQALAAGTQLPAQPVNQSVPSNEFDLPNPPAPGNLRTPAWENGAPNSDLKQRQNIWIGGSAGKAFDSAGTQFQALTELRGLGKTPNLGLRAAATLQGGELGVSAHAIYHFQNNNPFGGYLGAGAGTQGFSETVDLGNGLQETVKGQQTFISLLGGVEYSFTDTLSFFGEAEGRYLLGETVAEAANSDKQGMNLGVRAGVKVRF